MIPFTWKKHLSFDYIPSKKELENDVIAEV